LTNVTLLFAFVTQFSNGLAKLILVITVYYFCTFDQEIKSNLTGGEL